MSPANFWLQGFGAWEWSVTPANNLPHVLQFLKPGRSDLVSGCSMTDRSRLYARFVAALREKHPDIMSEVEAQQEAKIRYSKRQKVGMGYWH